MITEAQVDAALRAYFKIPPRERLGWLTPKIVADMRAALEAAEKAGSNTAESLPLDSNVAA
jgi:hypothetical protein